MPNWCEGTLKLRGKRADIERFLTNACHCSLPEYMDEEIVVKDLQYIEGTSRGFLGSNQSIYRFYGDEGTIYFRYIQAWDIYSEDLKKISLIYNLDCKIFACEQGMQFARDIEVLNGKIVKNEFIKYEDYYWECPCPDLGG